MILAGIVINALVGNNGLLGKTKDVRNITDIATVNEIETMDDLVAIMDSELVKNGDSVTINDIEDIDDSINMPEKKTDDELIKLGYIPIYTTDQFRQIATQTKNYKIVDLNGNDKGSYDMNQDSKYAIINDIDFSGISDYNGIREFRGEIEGNGSTIKNLNISLQFRNEPTANTFSKHSIIKYNLNAGIIGQAHDSKIQNLEIIDSVFDASNGDSAGAIIGQCSNTIIDNCYTKNCITSACCNAGGLVGNTWDEKTTIKNSKTINPKGTTISSYSKFGGVVGIGFSEIELDNCKTIYTTETQENSCYGMIYQIYIEDSNDINLTLKDCSIQNLNNNSSTIGGIVTRIITPSIPEENNSLISIKNCSAKNINGDNASGIVNQILSSAKVDIEECKVQDISKSNGGIAGSLQNSKNITINKCTAKNVEGKSGEPFGGCIGQIINIPENTDISIKNCVTTDNRNEEKCGVYGGIVGMINDNSIQFNINISNCYSGNMEIKSNGGDVGGIVGIIQGESNCKISRCISNEIKSSSTSEYSNGKIGGILGHISSMDQLSVNECYAKNINSTKSDQYGGIVGSIVIDRTKDTKKIEFTKCNAANIANEGEKTNNGSGIVGIISKYGTSKSIATFSDCNVSDLKIAAGGAASGIIGFSSIDINTSNCSAQNLNLEGASIGGIVGNTRNVIANNCYTYSLNIENYGNNVGGIIGITTGEKSTIKKCNSEQININTDVYHIGGIIGNNDKGSIDIEECNTNGITFNNTTEDFGGIIGNSFETLNISKCNVSDIQQNGISKISGGISACLHTSYYGEPSTNTINECNVSNSKIIANKEEQYMYINAGGIIAVPGSSNAKVNVLNCNVNNCEIISYQSAGGITSYSGTIENCNVEDTLIERRTYNEGTQQCGGITAFTSNSINNCKVVNSKIVNHLGNAGGITGINEGNVTNCQVDNSFIESEKSADASSSSGLSRDSGGIAGLNNNIISQCSITKSTIKGEKRVGGIAGLSDKDIEDCNIESSNIECLGDADDSEDGSEYISYTGGITGFGSGMLKNNTVKSCNITSQCIGTGGIVGHGSNSSNSDISTTVWLCNVENSEISGTYKVGGIAGAAAPNITECTISNSKIKGTKKYTGGIIGFGGIFPAESAKYYLPLTLTNCHVNSCEIYGNEYCNEIIGKHSCADGIDSLTNDKVSDCDAPGTTKTTI